MDLLSTRAQWGIVAKLFHWTMAVGLLGLAAYGFWMTDLPRGPAMLRAYALHKSWGLTLLALALLRLAWRAIDRRPEILPAPGWQRLAATSTHFALYGLMLGVPLAGWAYNSAANFPLQWFGLFNLPPLVPGNPVSREWFEAIHAGGALALLALAAVHVAAACKHHLVDRDGTLRRMLPGGVVRAPLLVLGSSLLIAGLLTPAAVLAAGAGTPTRTTAGAVPEWRMDAARSRLTFTGTQQGEAFTGRFTRFTPLLRFSPEALASSRWVVTIDVASNDSANRERDETMRTADWFDVARHPRATFITTGFRRGATAGSYLADGELSIKGRTARIVLPFRWSPAASGQTATLTAQVVLDRHAFGLGTGEWLDDAWVGKQVTVGVQLALVR